MKLSIIRMIVIAYAILGVAEVQAKELKFQLKGGYQFADSFKIVSDSPFVYAQAGQLTGSFLWEFEDGTTGATHINGATANRITTEGPELFGMMKINMFEMEGSPAESDLLFLSYEAESFKIDGTKVTIVVKGRFVGGSGKYKDASGELRVVSVNGYINEGNGIIKLPR